jgi:formylglycine-generating enzyme required for sulfatase activity
MIKRLGLIIGIMIATLGATSLACNLFPQPTPAPTPAGGPVAGGLTPTAPAMATMTPFAEEASAGSVQAAVYSLAIYLERDPDELSVISVQETQFADTALGCPRAGETAIPGATPGYTIILSDGSAEYELHTSLDGLQVRCLREEGRQSERPGSAGINATITALANREYGTLASLLPPTVSLGTYPNPAESLAASSFIAQLRDIWLGPGAVRIDLNTNVLALMPGFQPPADHISVFSTGWGATRDTDGILLFDISRQPPVLNQVILIPAAEKEAAYGSAAPEPEEPEALVGELYRGDNYTIAYPEGWFTSTVAGQANFQPPEAGIAVSIQPWPVTDVPREDGSFADWIRETSGQAVPGVEAIHGLEPVWAASGQAGYVVTWDRRRADGALESSDPIALFEQPFMQGEVERYALAVALLEPEYEPQFREMIASLIIERPGVPADMYIYRHDELGYGIQFPADWTLLPSPMGAAFQPPEEDVAVTIGPWPMAEGPTGDQTFEEWVAAAPSENIQGYGELTQMRPVETAGGETGYLATWHVSLPEGGIAESDPVAVYPFARRLEGDGGERVYHALAVSLHVPTYTQTFERMIATVVIEPRETAEMVYIPAGAFVRGSTDDQIGAWSTACSGGCRGDEFRDEAPQRIITLKAFYIDRTEVSVAQWHEFVDATGYRTTAEQKGDPIQFTWRAFDWPDRQNHPVRWLSWEDTNAYCQWAGKRLPTEAEWEKAARGTDGRTWPWGSNWNDALVPQGDTVPVDSYADGASPYGVLGMAGNVWEWVADWYGAGYYSAAPDTDPLGPPSGTDRVLRGGSFNNADWALRTAHRHYGGPTGYSMDHGFRCAADG